MARQNPFDGESDRAILAQKSYKRLISREWFELADIMADYYSLSSKEELPCNLSNCDHYQDLKDGFRDVRLYIEKLEGKEAIVKEGSTRAVRFKYVGKDDDPLASLWNAKAIKSLEKYWQFCQDSTGFFPSSWLEYFFKDCKDLFDAKVRERSGEKYIYTSLERKPKNIDFLPSLYEHIVRKEVLSVKHKPFVGEERTIMLHPHLLKEYNGRWHLLGYANETMGYHVPLDRIVEQPCVLEQEKYVSAPLRFYENTFRDVVGLSHFSESKTYDIKIRIHDKYVFGLFATKPIHHSQCVAMPFGEQGAYGEVSLHAIINKELVGQLLYYGNALEVIEPIELREKMRKEAELVLAKYQ